MKAALHHSLIITLLFALVIPVTFAESTELIKPSLHSLSPDPFIYKEVRPSTKSSFNVSVGDSTLSEKEQFEQKISRYVLEKLREVGPDTPISVTVGISHQYDPQTFLNENTTLNMNMTSQKINHDIEAHLTEDQIHKIAEQREVFWISLSSERVSIGIGDF